MKRAIPLLLLGAANCRTPPFPDWPDFATPDLSVVDLSTVHRPPVDLSIIDLSTVDQSKVDLEAPDLARPILWQSEAPFTADGYFLCVWAAAADQIYAGGAHDDAAVIYRGDGNGGWTLELEGQPNGGITAIWGSSPTDLYAVGFENPGAVIFHSHGDGKWQKTAATGELMRVWGTGPDDIYITDYYGGILHSTGDDVWSLVRSGDYQYVQISGSGPNDVYVSTWPSPLHWDGSVWTPLTQSCRPVFATGDDIYGWDFTNSPASLCHRGSDGNWSLQKAPFLPDALWASGSDDVFGIVEYGQPGRLERSDGRGNWIELPLPSEDLPLLAIGGWSRTDLYLVGYNGLLYHGRR